MRRFYAAVVVVSALAVCPAAFGQQQGRGVDPNIVHFYMARQEIQILDDAPAVNDMRTQPGPPGSQRGAIPNRPQGLPHAGFMPYSQTIPSLKNSLPQVYTGVPQRPGAGLPAVNPRLAKAGVYRGGKPGSKGGVAGAGPTERRSVAPAVAKTYAPYKGYGVHGTSSPMPTSASAGSAASTHVSGSLMNRSAGTSMLHWRRTSN